MLDTMKNLVTDVAGVEQKFGVPPALIVDWLALVGDSVRQHSRRAGRRTGHRRQVAASIRFAGCADRRCHRHHRQDRRQTARRFGRNCHCRGNWRPWIVRSRCPSRLRNCDPRRPIPPRCGRCTSVIEFRAWLRDLSAASPAHPAPGAGTDSAGARFSGNPRRTGDLSTHSRSSRRSTNG
jgi:hypothetical protein